MFYDRIQDKTLGINFSFKFLEVRIFLIAFSSFLDVAIKAFSFWSEEAKADQYCDPLSTYEKMMAEEKAISPELSSKLDHVLLDTIMYSDMELTKVTFSRSLSSVSKAVYFYIPQFPQQAIHLLMVHKSQRDLFYDVAEQIQIVTSPKVESVCHSLSAVVHELRKSAETYEIWSDLETGSDLAKAARVQGLLKQMTQTVSKPNTDKTLGIRYPVLTYEEVQNTLRNLDAMEVFITLQIALFDGGREELKPTIREILGACNDLICLYVRNSESNQADAFRYINWFVERIDDGINTSKVLRAIFEGNKGETSLV